MQHTFTKQERLNSKKKIEQLFKKGITKRAGCINMIYRITDQELDTPVQVLFSAPKKQFHRAVDRNLLKRRMREAYRLNKKAITEVCRKANKNMIVAFIYSGKTIALYTEIEEKMKSLLEVIELIK